MKKIALIFFTILALSTNVFSESRSLLSGRVVLDYQGVPFLSVQIKGTTIGTVTDGKGQFELFNSPDESFEIVVGGLGYKPVTQKINQATAKDQVIINIEPEVLFLNEVVVSGSRVGVLKHLPGSVSFINSQGLAAANPLSANEILRTLPGVHVVDEERAGLRINVGIRGLDPSRSRKVLMLEDGILVALAPYGEPQMYYSPNIERMISGQMIFFGC